LTNHINIERRSQVSDYDKEMLLVLALASGASVAAAARKTGCSARTLFRRLEDEAFRRQIARARTQLVTRATSMLAQTSIRAVATLRKLLNDQNPSVKRMAARGVLDALARLSGQGEIEERVAELETVVLGDMNREYQEPSEETSDCGEGMDPAEAAGASGGG
jgi:transposase-like protein